MKKLLIISFSLFLEIFHLPVFSFPKEVIIIRHADKLQQTDPGPCLAPKGIARSIAFAFYFLEKFSEPDFIITTNPIKEEGKDSSIRELQTIAPLANMLAQKHPDTGFPILHPYASSDYKKLANDLLYAQQFDGKRILICWNHKKIPQLAEELGVQEELDKWPSADFDTVFILHYNNEGKVEKFERLGSSRSNLGRIKK